MRDRAQVTHTVKLDHRCSRERVAKQADRPTGSRGESVGPPFGELAVVFFIFDQAVHTSVQHAGVVRPCGSLVHAQGGEIGRCNHWGDAPCKLETAGPPRCERIVEERLQKIRFQHPGCPCEYR